MEAASSISDMELLHRFLVYGRDDGMYFAGYNSSITDIHKYSQSLDRLLAEERGIDVVELIKSISKEGRAPRQTPLLYALAVCARSNDTRVRTAAYKSINDICRIPTHLFTFVAFATKRGAGKFAPKNGGWGRSPRKAVSEWYNQKRFVDNPKSLVRKCCKYRRRRNYTHRDILRLAHVKPKTHHLDIVFRYLVKGFDGVDNSIEISDNMINEVNSYILAVEEAKLCSERQSDISRLTQIIRTHGLTLEHIPNNLLGLKDIWMALIHKLPMGALIRNLGRMSHVGILSPNSLEERLVIERLGQRDRIQKARIHPLNILTTWNVYKCGTAFTSDQPMQWTPNDAISTALERAFYLSFPSPVPSGKKIIIAVDGSEHMNQPVIGMPSVTARGAAVSFALFIAKIETNVAGQLDVRLISVAGDDIQEVELSGNDDLQSLSERFAIEASSSVVSDAAMPVQWCLRNRVRCDAIVYLSSSMVAATTSLLQSMREYREDLGLHNTRFVSVILSSKVSPTPGLDNDHNMLSIVGFDSRAMAVVLDFLRRP